LAAFDQSPHDFDLVVLDQTMLKITGVEVTKKMVRTRPDIPLFFVPDSPRRFPRRGRK
jgi:CheY-like chemotaxis protein